MSGVERMMGAQEEEEEKKIWMDTQEQEIQEEEEKRRFLNTQKEGIQERQKKRWLDAQEKEAQGEEEKKIWLDTQEETEKEKRRWPTAQEEKEKTYLDAQEEVEHKKMKRWQHTREEENEEETNIEDDKEKKKGWHDMQEEEIQDEKKKRCLGSEDDRGTLSSFEELLEAAGTGGRWNVLMFLMCAAVGFISPFHMLSYQFLGATPDHWCLVPQLVTANWTQHQVLSLAIPYSNDSSSYDSCRMYDYDYDEVAAMGYEAAMANRSSLATNSDSPKECEARDFNRTQYQSTVVTEWDLVCERRPLYSTTQAVVMAGKMVGCLVFGYVSDRYGRRPIALITSVFYILGAFLTAASPNLFIYITLKGFVNCMDTGLYLCAFVFVMESCSTKHRATAGALLILPWALGYMAVPGISYLVRDWQLLQVAYALPTLYSLIFFWWLPESPHWLITLGRFQEALQVLTWAARVNRKTLPHDSVVLAAMANIHKQGSDDGGLGDDVDRAWWRRVLEMMKHFVILLLIPQLRFRAAVVFFCWFASSMICYGIALNADNLGTDPYLYIFLGGVTEVISYLLLWPALVFLGRRRVQVILYLLGAVCIFGVMVLVLERPQGSQWVVVLFSQAGKVAVRAAFQLAWAYIPELFPTRYRSLAIGQATFFSKFGSLCSPYINDLLGERAVWAPSALFSGVSLSLAALTLTFPVDEQN